MQELFCIFIVILLNLFSSRGFLGNEFIGAGLTEVRFPGIAFLISFSAESPLSLFLLLLQAQEFLPPFITLKTATMSCQCRLLNLSTTGSPIRSYISD